MARKSAAERFWDKVERTDECWRWKAAKQRQGFGVLSVGGKMVPAHRYSWELHNGPIPEGHNVLQSCQNRNCPRPDHLYLRDTADGEYFHAQASRSSKARLTSAQVKEIREAWEPRRVTQAQLEERYQVHPWIIYAILRGLLWKHVNPPAAVRPTRAGALPRPK